MFVSSAMVSRRYRPVVNVAEKMRRRLPFISPSLPSVRSFDKYPKIVAVTLLYI